MWVIVEFVDDVVVAVPISWVIKSNGMNQCFWPKRDERSKRTNSEIPPALLTDDWELHDCVLLLSGAIYLDFEDALAIEMGCIDINEVNTDGLPKLSWKDDESETENTETSMQCEASAVENVTLSEFQELLNRPDLCSTLNEITNEHNLLKGVENVLPSVRSEMLDKILKNQGEKKNMLVKLMAKMYSLESAVGYNPQDMNRVLLNEKQRIKRRAKRFVDLNYSQQRLGQTSQQLNSGPTDAGINFAAKLDLNQPLPPSESTEENADCINGVGELLLSFIDEEVFDVLSSDSSDDEEEHVQRTFDLKKALAEWVVNAKIPAYHVDKLLTILRNIAPSLPKCSKTLCKTPRTANIIEMDNGHYLHVGLQNCLNRFLSNNNFIGDCITIDINVDGVGVSKSSTSDIWPILVSVVGYKDILMPGAFHGTKKPVNVNNYLQRFVDEYNELSGGFRYNNKVYSLHIRAIVADIPARTFILNSIGHTGYSSCTKCTIRGERIFNTICFPGFDFDLRSDASVRNRDDEHHHHSMEPTMVESLPINLVDDVVVETMHCVYLGLQKQMLKLWILNRRERYSMSAANIRKMSSEILNISHQLPNEFSRFPRPLNYLKRYKATEFRQLLLYTLPVLLEGKINKVYYDHFLKLHCAMRILCDPVQCIINNELSYKLLKAFVRDFPELYGREKVTFNGHSLLHIPADVKKMNAPVEDYSAFKFENYLQYVKSLPRTGYKVLEQMHNRICEKNSIDNYLGDFKKYSKNDRLMKNSKTIYKKVHIFNMILSVQIPDNYVLIEKKVHKIEEISKKADGDVVIKSRIVQDLNPLYSKPISSMDVNVFVGGQEKLSEAYDRVVCRKTKKCTAINLDNKFIYMALLH